MLQKLGIAEINSIGKNKKTKANATEKLEVVVAKNKAMVMVARKEKESNMELLEKEEERSVVVAKDVDMTCWSYKKNLVSVNSLFCCHYGVKQLGSETNSEEKDLDHAEVPKGCDEPEENDPDHTDVQKGCDEPNVFSIFDRQLIYERVFHP
jgi:hypothetical protein